MAKLFIPKTNETIIDFAKIKSLLNGHGIMIEKWEASAPLADDADQEVYTMVSTFQVLLAVCFRYCCADICLPSL